MSLSVSCSDSSSPPGQQSPHPAWYRKILLKAHQFKYFWFVRLIFLAWSIWPQHSEFWPASEDCQLSWDLLLAGLWLMRPVLRRILSLMWTPATTRSPSTYHSASSPLLPSAISSPTSSRGLLRRTRTRHHHLLLWHEWRNLAVNCYVSMMRIPSYLLELNHWRASLTLWPLTSCFIKQMENILWIIYTFETLS